jgi:hypothetical protein
VAKLDHGVNQLLERRSALTTPAPCRHRMPLRSRDLRRRSRPRLPLGRTSTCRPSSLPASRKRSADEIKF